MIMLRAGKPRELSARLGLADVLKRLHPLVRDVHQLCVGFLACGVLLRVQFPDQNYEHLDVQSNDFEGVEQ
jgi:hypothetical protein